MMSVIWMSLLLLGFVGLGVLGFLAGRKVFAVSVLVIVSLFFVGLVSQSNLYNLNGLHISQESQQQFESQLKDIMSVEVVESPNYDFRQQGELDIEIDGQEYVVEFNYEEGSPIVESISQDEEVLYERNVIEWDVEPISEVSQNR